MWQKHNSQLAKFERSSLRVPRCRFLDNYPARMRVEWYHLSEEKLLFHSNGEKQSFALSMPPQVENSWAAY
jgi:hypothetical protein